MGVNSLPWYYLKPLTSAGEDVVLDGDEWHHCYHVMRMRENQTVLLCDGLGKCMEGMIRHVSPKKGTISLERDLSDQFKNPRNYHLTIALAPTKNIDRTEFAVEKLTEIGVDEIYFLDCQHNERTHLRIDRMEKIIHAAAKQSRKAFFPHVFGMITPQSLIEKRKGDQILACHLDNDTRSLSENYSPDKDVVVLIGPEGGFSEEEIESMKKYPVKFTHLGPFRLRVETAAIVACTGIHLIHQKNPS